MRLSQNTRCSSYDPSYHLRNVDHDLRNLYLRLALRALQMSRPKKYATTEELRAARRIQTRDSQRQRRAAARKAAHPDQPYRAHEGHRFRPDRTAMREREEHLQVLRAVGLTIEQLVLGDPEPGRSALAKMKR